MKYLKFNFDAASFTKSGELIGEIYFSTPDGYFPAEGWSDFASALPVWWLEALNKLDEPSVNEVELDFMEGDFKVNAKWFGANIIRLEFYGEGGMNPIPCINVEYEELYNEIRQVHASALEKLRLRLQ